MALQSVGTAKEVWSFWTVKWSALMALVFSAAGAGWMALDMEQQDALLGLFGQTRSDMSGLFALVLFIGAFTSAFTIGLRALKQTTPADPDFVDTVPAGDAP